MTYKMTCSCGDVLAVDAGTRQEAVLKMKAVMTEGMVTDHMAQKHPGRRIPQISEVHKDIEKGLKAAA